jgi:hypothetical protein
MTKEEIMKFIKEANTQQLFDYAYNLGWKDAMDKMLKETNDFYNKQ